MFNPHIAMYVLFFWLITETHVNRIISLYRYVDEIYTLLLIIYIVAAFCFNKIRTGKTIFYGTTLYLAIIIASIIVNEAPLDISFQSSLLFLKPWVLYIFFVSRGHDFNIRPTIINLVKLYIIVGIINLFVVLALRAIIGEAYYQDDATGLMGDAHVCGEYFYVMLLYAFYQIQFRKKYKYIYFVLIGFFGFWVVEALQLLVILLAVPFFLYLVDKKHLARKLTIISAIVVVFAFLFNNVFIYNTEFRRQYERVLYMFDAYELMPDYICMEELVLYGQYEIPTLWLGAGPGMYSSNVAQNTFTYFFKKYMVYLMDMFKGHGTINDPLNQIHMVWSELGYLGLIVFMFMTIYVGVVGIQAYNNAEKKDRWIPYIYIGVYMHIWGRFVIVDTFFMNDSLLLLIVVFPFLLKINADSRKAKLLQTKALTN